MRGGVPGKGRQAVQPRRAARRWLAEARAVVLLLTACATVIALATPAAHSRTMSPPHAAPAADANGAAPLGRPLIVGHHGAAGQLPANTLASFALAIAQGADYIEPDVVLTRDGVLIARHENDLGYTTDVARHREFASKRRVKHINGYTYTGWFAEDFTLAQLQQLRVRAAAGMPVAAGGYQIPTLQQIIDLVRTDERILHRTIGLSIEIKDGDFLASIGMPVEPRLAALLAHNRLNRADSPVLVESPETAVLARLHRLVPVPMVWVLPALPGPAGRAALIAALPGVARYAAGVAVDRSWLAPLLTAASGPADGVRASPDAIPPARLSALTARRLARSTAWAGEMLVETVRANGLSLYVYTLGTVRSDYLAYAQLGVDGIFSDDPNVAVQAYR